MKPTGTDADAAIRSELHAGERLLWSGQPRGGIRLRKADIALVPLSLVWASFAFFWSFHVLSIPGVPPLFVTVGTLFLLLAIYVTVGRFFFDWFRRANTHYGITDQRIVIVRGWLNRDVRTFPLHLLGEVSLDETGDGSGSILFDSTSPNSWSRNEWSALSGRFVPAFERVEHVHGVYAVIREKQRDAATPDSH